MKQGMVSMAIAAALMLAGATADTREARTTDGCQELESSVYRAVLAASAGWHRPLTGHAAGADWTLVCAESTRAVSAGFTKAMMQRNVFLSWTSPDQERGDMCLSADLSQCYPNRNPYVPMGAGDAAFVADSWHAVQRAIAKSMPGGHDRDLTRFAQSGMTRQLDAELARTLRGRSQQAYYFR